VVNTAPQTDSEGNTISAPGAGSDTSGGDTSGSDTSGAPSGGDAAAGETAFATKCQGCHANLGQEAGAGPKLAGLGLDAERIEMQVVNGGGAMPPGLAEGEELDNIVAFVLSIQ
jgi:mono/diheme cytochrome c family protein